MQLHKPSDTHIYIYDDQPVSKSRTKIVKHAFEYGATHLLFLDDDMIIPPNALDILFGHDKDIVGLLAFKRKEPFFPVIYKENAIDRKRLVTWFDYPEGLIPVAATGCACMLIKMDVFRNINFPWFKFEDDPDYPGEMIGEDFYFCKKAKEYGYQIWVDTMRGHTIGHLGIGEVNEKVWDKFRQDKYGQLGTVQVDRLGNLIPSPEKIILE